MTPNASQWPNAAINSQTAGVAEIVVSGDCRNLGVFQPIEPFVMRGENGTIGGMELNNSGIYHPHGSVVRNLTFTGMLDCRINDGTFENLKWGTLLSQCIRIRFGASRNRFSNLYIRREPPLPTSDRVAIQLSDGQCLDNIIENSVILNYTDGIQTTHRTNPDGSSDDYGIVAGLTIRNNTIGFDDAVFDGPVNNLPGCENALDFKTGGTIEKPIIVENNRLINVRPVPAHSGGGNPKGYAITYHNCASDLMIRENRFERCGSAIFNNIQYNRNLGAAAGVFNPRNFVLNNILIETPILFVGPGAVTASGNVFQ